MSRDFRDYRTHAKEASPAETVRRAQQILAGLGLKPVVTQKLQSLTDCWSCRLTIEGDLYEVFASNGKGMTEELCMASAYGELMERMQARIFSWRPPVTDDLYEQLMLQGTPVYDLDTADEPDCVKKFCETIMETMSLPPFLSRKEVLKAALAKAAPDNLHGRFDTLPYYSLKEDRLVHLPSFMQYFRGSNGLAAGNTYEEAMVEAFSEIYERTAQCILLDNDSIVPPQIPRDYLQNYPHIADIIREIEADGRYKVRVLDCSLGRNLPVAAGVIIDTQTGMFGVKFGAQPDISIALERIFTESLQGFELHGSANRSEPYFVRNNAAYRRDRWNSMKICSASMPASFLRDDASYAFVPWPDTEGKSNREVMFSVIDHIESMGCDIYVRDASYLGFCTVDIYVTGMSDVKHIMDFTSVKQYVLECNAMRYFTRLDTLTDDEVKDISIVAASKVGALLEDKISMITGVPFEQEMPFAVSEAEGLYALAQYRLGEYRRAADMFLRIAHRAAADHNDHGALQARAAAYYADGMANGTDRERIENIVRNLCPTEADWAIDVFGDRMHTLAKAYPMFDGKPLTQMTAGGCRFKTMHDAYKMLVDCENRNPADVETVRALFRR